MENMRKLRKEKGITAKQLAEMVGVSEVSITQYETGNRSPKRDTLLRIAAALGTSVEYLAGKKESPAQEMDRTEARIMETVKSLTPSQKAHLLSYLAGLTASQED